MSPDVINRRGDYNIQEIVGCTSMADNDKPKAANAKQIKLQSSSLINPLTYLSKQKKRKETAWYWNQGITITLYITYID